MSLTPTQARLLRFIAGYQAAHGGVSPTLEECRRALGQKAKSNICRMMSCLEERGAIRTLAGHARAIELIERPSIPSIGGAPLYAVPLIPSPSMIFSGERP
ncbi:LexA family protein [Novosphingobium huizhouense]|uniref:LexA family protein n=1 Tax=Novosphingobium huizhouense TaxID=2866625 RepID=UPI001CD867FB|nr:hypothetical protein [Novosphingobium huizhouense]